MRGEIKLSFPPELVRKHSGSAISKIIVAGCGDWPLQIPGLVGFMGYGDVWGFESNMGI